MEKIFFFLFFLTSICWAVDITDVVVVILSQENPHHLQMAESLRNNLKSQSEEEELVVHLSHVDFAHVGDWTILPLIPHVCTLHSKNSSWILFLEDRTNVTLSKLLHVLNKYDEKQSMWLGYAVHDNEPTIIHHFAFYDDPKQFLFPHLGAGVAFSTALIIDLAHRLERQGGTQSEFGIDSAHELALFVWDKGRGQAMQHEDLLCSKQAPECATFPTTFQQCQDNSVAPNSIYFAVKTCKKFHKDRISVVQNTWGRHAEKIRFFSDFADKSIPSISLGIPNSDQGHCRKTLAILRYVYEELKLLPDVQWVVVADDDTILSVSRLGELLTCYDPSTPVALGERYGYNVQHSLGYNYITGGGGMVFSKILLEMLIEDGNCKCPSLTTPDDMFLGLCIASLGVSITHSPLFHQARPIDYPKEYLDKPVSFHKHWMIDPVKVYEEWFGDKEEDFFHVHNEL